jgi:hypothetical protein
MNRITKEERECIYARASELHATGMDLGDVADQLQTEFGISKQRAVSAAARAIRRARSKK